MLQTAPQVIRSPCSNPIPATEKLPGFPLPYKGEFPYNSEHHK
jgi:hypothetical protein